MTIQEFIKKLGIALDDEDTAKALESFGITSTNYEGIKDLNIPTTLDEALKDTSIQSEYDRRLGKAVQTREENLKSKYDFKEKDDTPPSDPPSTNPALEALTKQLQAMQDKFSDLEKEKITQTLEQKKTAFTARLTEKGIPKIYASVFDPEKDMDSQMETVEKQYSEDTPTRPNHGANRLPKPGNPGERKPSKEEIADIVG